MICVACFSSGGSEPSTQKSFRHHGFFMSVCTPSTLRTNDTINATAASIHQMLGWLLKIVVDTSIVAAIEATAPEVIASLRIADDFKTFARLNFMAHDHDRMITDVPDIANRISSFLGRVSSIRRYEAYTKFLSEINAY